MIWTFINHYDLNGSVSMISDLVKIGKAKMNLKYLSTHAPLSAAIACLSQGSFPVLSM